MPHLLKQRYLITGIVGRGGMGVVYKARDTQLGNRLVAIKEMQRGSNDQDALDAFKHEAEILAHLLHPHLPSIHEHFVESGWCYLVMEFIEGETLETYVKAKGGYLSCDETIEIGLQLCTVLDYLHTRQPPIIFRDLKPLNIMLSSEGHLYLIDFGIARHFKSGQARDTAVAYSVGYAAPEQYSPLLTQTTPLSDIYSLGATLRRVLTGYNPSLQQPMPSNFLPLQLRGQTASAELEALIMQMIDPIASKRPASIRHVKQRLQHIAAQRIVFPAERRETYNLTEQREISNSAKQREISNSAKRREISDPAAPTFVSPPSEAKQGFSRRLFLTGVATLALASGGVIGWRAIQNSSTLAPTPTPVPASTSVPTPTPTSPPNSAPNLALNKTVYSNNSLELSPWGANRLTDGVETSLPTSTNGYTSNGFSSSNLSNNSPYVVIDLGSNQPFNTVKLFPRTDTLTVDGGSANFPVNFTIQVSNGTLTNGILNYSTVATVTNQANPQGVAQTYAFPTITGRYVAVSATTLGTPARDETSVYRMQLAEMEVFFTNLARTASISASSDLEAHGFSLNAVIDGQLTSSPTAAGWTSNDNLTSNHTEWLQLNFGSQQTFSEVDLYPRTDAGNSGAGFPIDFTIAISNDNSTWTPVVTKTGYPLPTGVQQFALTSQKAQYVRVTGTSLRSNPNDGNLYRMQFAEITVY